MSSDDEALHALEAGISEANRRERGDFDGLLGQIPREGSRLLAQLVSELRDVILTHYTDQEARSLLDEHEPRPGYRNVTPIPDPQVELAVRLLNKIRLAMRLEGEALSDFVLGSAGARDKKAQSGRSGGGKSAGKLRKEKATEFQARCEERERALIEQGKNPRSLASIIADQLGVDPSTVRRALKKTRTS